MIVINGKFLGQRITGVQRAALEIVKRLDKKVDQLDDELYIAIPSSLKENFKQLSLKNIKPVFIGHDKASAFWEHFQLGIYLKNKKASCFSFSSSFPIFCNKGLYFIHDINPLINSQYFSKKYQLYTRFILDHVTRSDVKIVTNSYTSKLAILRRYPGLKSRIAVVYLGWEHVLTAKLDLSILDRFHLQFKGYFIVVATLTKHKNLEVVLKAAQIRPDLLFVVVGGKPIEKVFGRHDIPNIPNVIFTGYLTDEEMFSLIKGATALIFPSLYEGFGLPALEAIALGTPVVLSKIEAFQELFRNVGTFFDPFSEEELIESLNKVSYNETEAKKILSEFSWDRSVERIILFTCGGG